MSLKKPEVCVIGAGLAGMAIALRLAARGWQVSVFENSATLGGKMNRWECDGFRFDTGPSLITMPWVFEDLFSAAGERMGDHVRLQPVDPLARYLFADRGQLDIGASLPRWLETLRKVEPRGDIQFLKMMQLGARLFELSRHTFFRRAPSEPPDWETFAALRHMPFRRGWGSYRKAVHGFFSSPRLRQIYERFPTYVGSSPSRIPATLMLIPYLEHAFGAWHVMGGLYTVIEKLRELGEKHGVRFFTGSRVVKIHTASRKVESVELADGSIRPCSAVIMNGDASTLPAPAGGTRIRPAPRGSPVAFGICITVRSAKKAAGGASYDLFLSRL